MADDPDLTGRVRLDLSGLVEGLRFAQAVTRRQISNLVRDANARLRGLDTSRLSAGLARVGSMIGGLARLAVPFAAAGAAVGSLVPLVGGLAAALAQMAPAAAVAVSGLIAMQLAAGTFKLAMTGVGDAVKAALDPSDPEAYAEALKKLSPNARSFVQEIRKASPALDKIRKTVQDKVFSGLDTQLRSTAKAALPALRTALNSTATTLNQMGKGVFTAARNLAKDGTLGTALKGATDGLAEFRKAPGQVVTALGQIGAAAAPAFKRLSAAGAGALDRLSAKLTAAFESGAMEKAIDTAIDLFAQLGRVVGNIGGILKNVFGGLTSSGQGLFSTLETITASLREATGTDGFRRALAALSQTMGVVAKTVGPLLGQALAVLGPVIEKLAPPAQQLVKVLGSALSKILTALGPVLSSAASAVGSLVVALLPLVEVGGELIAAVLPALVPLFDSLAAIFVEMAPTIQALADNLAAQLVPLLAALTPILEEILPPFVQLAAEIFPQLTKILVELAPELLECSESLASIAVEVAPLVGKLLELAAVMLSQVLPAVGPIIVGAVRILAAILSALADIVERYVMPAIRAVAALLQGDFSGAAKHAGVIVANFKEDALRALSALVAQAGPLLVQFAGAMGRHAQEAGQRLLSAVGTKITDTIRYIQGMPARIAGSLPSAGSILQGAGRAIMQGLINGITSMIPSLSGTLNSITSMIPDWKGPKKKDASLLTPAGKSIIKGLIAGIDASTASLKSKLTSITNTIARAIDINKGNRKKVGGLSSLLTRVEKDNKKLVGLAKSRDKVAAALKTAQKKLDDAIATRAKKAADIRDGILGDANITSGNTLVNSVAAITVGLQQAVAKAKAFGANLAELKKSGLRADLLGDIAEAGVDGGAATAAALAKATPAELAKINALQAQLTTAATSTGTSVAGALYDSGVKAAQGLVDGLKKQQKNIEKQMTSIANAMVKAIKKALKIKSPSRVFMGLGEMTGAGLREGMLRSRTAVAAASSSMAAAAVGAADVASRAMANVPAPGQLSASYAGTQGGGDTHNVFNLYQTEATPEGILRAQSWAGLVRGR
ncbi:hypothetical protein [Streptomyces sp. IBSNAI001]|uniref:hypothetical protein n=1 Tax=Streptomyces sp. IBSNAI001 TaxID=3457499 RepID=UPI003FD2B3BE